MREEHIGARIAAERRLRGLTQRQLADRVHVSHSLVTKVERGDRPATPALVAAVARILRVEQGRLTGQPYFTGDRADDAVHDLIPDLRREITSYGLPPDDNEPRPDLSTLGARVAHASGFVHDVDYIRLGETLPALLADLRAAAFTADGATRERVMLWMAETYDNAKRVAYDLGYPDLGAHAVALKEQAAAESGDPLAVAVAAAVRGWTLIGTGAFDAASRVLAAALVDLEPLTRNPTAPTWSVWGFLNLQAALAAARAADSSTAWDYFAEAERATAAVGVDRDDFRLAFGPTNTAIWGVALAVELQDGAAAVARAARVRIPADLPKARASHHFLDLSRGYLYYGDRQSALGALVTARRHAPQQVRYNPMARETVYALAQAERRSSESLRSLATWMGIPD